MNYGIFKDLLIKTGPMALLVAMAGVFVPLGGGFLLSSVFHGFAPVGSEEFFRSVFIGVIMTATSVSITVETLRELGKLRGKVGTTILSAAIIDDVIARSDQHGAVLCGSDRGRLPLLLPV